MARTYKRDARGRFASGGGGGGGKGGGKGGGGASKPAAKAKAKAAPAAKPAAKRGAPAGARGGKVGTPAQQRKAAREQQQRQKAFASKATAGRSAKQAYKAATSAARTGRRAQFETSSRLLASMAAAKQKGAPTAKAKAAPAAKPATSKRKPDFKPRGKNQTAQSTIAEADARARLSAGRKLRGAGKTPASRAERNLQRGLLTGGRKGIRTAATAKRAIDFLAATGGGRKAKKSTAPKGKGSSKKR